MPLNKTKLDNKKWRKKSFYLYKFFQHKKKVKQKVNIEDMFSLVENN